MPVSPARTPITPATTGPNPYAAAVGTGTVTRPTAPPSLVILLRNIDDFPGVQSHAGVTGNLKFCHSTLTQFHNTLSQFQFHSAALNIFFVKTPRKSHGMLAYDRATVLFFHIPTSFYVVYWLTICILTVAIFHVNRNISYKHTK